MSAWDTQYHLKTRSGYTLIEILVALTIIGILFGVGYANFRDFSRRQQLAGIKKMVEGDLRLAQEMALSGQKPADHSCDSPKTLVGIRVNWNSTTYTLQYHCSDNAITDIKTVTISGGVSVSNPTPNPLEFYVLSRGINSSSDSVIQLQQAGTSSTATITVSSGGVVK